MPKTKISELEQLGYQVGFAHGSVAAEEEATKQARKDAHPGLLAEQAQSVTSETIQQLANSGQLSDDPAERQALAMQIGLAALDELRGRANGRIRFHERALEIAREMPDVFVISGPGVTNIYVACKADGTGWDPDQQAILDALADPDAHKERRKQEKAESP